MTPLKTLALARLGVMEMLCSGATTIVDYYRKPDALARAAEEFGLRAMVGGRVMDADTAQLAQGRFVHDPKLGDETMRDALDLIDRWDGKADGRISAIHAPHAPDTCSSALLAEIAAICRSEGIWLHIDGAYGGFAAACSEVYEEHKSSPADSVMDAWVSAERRGLELQDFDLDRIISDCLLLLDGGAETTRTVIGRTILTLISIAFA